MPDPKKPVTPPASAPAETPDAPRTGGFGRFAEVYRARWAANHPNMRPRGAVQPTDGPLEALNPVAAALEPLHTALEAPNAPDASAKNKPLIENEMRLPHPWERR